MGKSRSATPVPPETSDSCYHCAETIPADYHLFASIEGSQQPVCCPGCKAVAELIDSSGLAAFYQLRTSFNERPEQTALDASYASYDLPENQSGFVSRDDDTASARILVTSISCAACTWLIEQGLSRVPGIEYADVNLAEQALQVRWRDSEIKLSRIFSELAALGYRAYPWRAREAEEALAQQQRRSLSELAVAGIAMMQVGMFGIALHAGGMQGIAEEYRDLLRWVSLLVATLVVGYSARSFFRNTWNNLCRGHLVMDLPVALAIGLAWLASCWATVSSTGEVYFDSIAMFTFFLLLGRFLEQRIRRREMLRQSDLTSLLPGLVKRQVNNNTEEVALTQLKTGDLVLPYVGESLPADGLVVSGQGHVDEAAFSGEHFPRNISTGDRVAAGTLLLDGELSVQVETLGEDTRIGQLLQLTHRAADDKPALQSFADRVAAYFVATILCIAAAVAWYWWQHEPSRALWITLSVLVVSCPCALALATPAALAAAGSGLRHKGIILLGANTLEQLPKIDTLVFDKTGTLTQGRVSILETRCHGDLDTETCLGLAAALEQSNRHPIASAFRGMAVDKSVSNIEVHVGSGVSGQWQSTELRLGAPGWCEQLNPGMGATPTDQGRWIAMTTANQLLAWFKLGDELREDAVSAVHALQGIGLELELLSGDSSDEVDMVAETLGIEQRHRAQTPDQKLSHIHALQASGKCVAMVGDGLNDAPVLAAANVSFAVAGATDVAKARADIIIASERLASLPETLLTATRCRRVMYQNFAWALCYNALAVPFAAMGAIPPWAAALGMSLSSLLVVINSLRLN